MTNLICHVVNLAHLLETQLKLLERPSCCDMQLCVSQLDARVPFVQVVISTAEHGGLHRQHYMGYAIVSRTQPHVFPDDMTARFTNKRNYLLQGCSDCVGFFDQHRHSHPLALLRTVIGL